MIRSIVFWLIGFYNKQGNSKSFTMDITGVNQLLKHLLLEATSQPLMVQFMLLFPSGVNIILETPDAVLIIEKL